MSNENYKKINENGMRVLIIILCVFFFPTIMLISVLITSGFVPYSAHDIPVEITSDISSIEPLKPTDDIIYTATASSYLNINNKYIYYPENICDNDETTAWFEGSNNSGVYEWIKLDLGDIYELSGISIINGWAKSEKNYYNESRVKKILIECDNSFTMEADLNDGILTPQEIHFNKKINSSYVKITILDTYKGDNDLYTAISEIKVF